MKTDTQIMNELAVSSGYIKPIAEEDAKALKILLLDMYKDISALCDKHRLEYMLGGGSCLGAIRHQGYIPWDDDLDMMMPRASYEELIRLCDQGELGEKYEIDVPRKDRESRNTFLKIYRKNSLDVEITSENTPGPNGIFIDVFPMDFAPKNALMRKIKGLFSDVLQTISVCVLFAKYPSQRYKEFMMQSKESAKRYRLRMALGNVFGIIPHRKWVWWFDQFNFCANDTGWLTIPTGRKHYVGECRPTSIYLPTTKTLFEGIEVNVPSNCHEYLTSMYRNYMEIPPVEKRERHFVYKFKLPEE